jgi:two-component system capsular synthesis response regulator RcsB
VLRHFIRGESMMQVAETLKRSVKTVSGQKISAMRKLNVQTDQELVAFCVESEIFQ